MLFKSKKLDLREVNIIYQIFSIKKRTISSSNKSLMVLVNRIELFAEAYHASVLPLY